MKEEKIKFENWGLLEKYLEDERSFYQIISSLDVFWDRTWLDAYLSEDRGYEVSLPLYESISTQFKKLEELTSQLVTEIPAMQKELFVMHNLYENFLQPVKKMIYETIPSIKNQRENKLIFLPQEWIEVSDSLSRVKTYLDYRNGANLLRYWYFVNNEQMKNLVKSFKEALITFTKAWEFKYSPNSSEELGFLTFCVIDSYNDPSILQKLLRNKETKQILLNEIPEEGIKRIVLASNGQKKKIEESLMKRTYRELLSVGNSLKIRAERENFKNYIEEILKLSGFLDYLSYVL
ncbi:MAG: hypothetical protein QXQ69_00570 [Candidatus Aenigmatarchaeota archaeon]